MVRRWYGDGTAMVRRRGRRGALRMLLPFSLRRRTANRIRSPGLGERRGECPSAFSLPVATWRAALRLSPFRVAVTTFPNRDYHLSALRLPPFCIAVIIFPRRGYPPAVAYYWPVLLVARGALFGKSTLRGGTFTHSLCVRILLYYSTLLIINILYLAPGTSMGIYGLAARNVVPSRRVWRGREAGMGSGAFTGIFEPATLALGCLNLRILRLWI